MINNIILLCTSGHHGSMCIMVVCAFDVKQLHNPTFLAPYLLQEKMFDRSQTFIQPALFNKWVMASVVQHSNICLGLHSTLTFIKHYMSLAHFGKFISKLWLTQWCSQRGGWWGSWLPKLPCRIVCQKISVLSCKIWVVRKADGSKEIDCVEIVVYCNSGQTLSKILIMTLMTQYLHYSHCLHHLWIFAILTYDIRQLFVHNSHCPLAVCWWNMRLQASL